MAKRMDNRQPKHYEVGYGKPPREYRFKLGNPGFSKAMRCKRDLYSRKQLTLEELFGKELENKITIREKGKLIRMTKMEALVRRAVNEAVKGDKQLMKMLFSMQIKEPPGAEVVTNVIAPETFLLFEQVREDAKTFIAEDQALRQGDEPREDSTEGFEEDDSGCDRAGS